MASEDFNEEILKETIIDSFGSDRDQFNSFIGIFETYVNELQSLTDPVDIGRAAHKMKAGAGAFGATSLLTALQELEADIKNNNGQNLKNLHEHAKQKSLESIGTIKDLANNILKA